MDLIPLTPVARHENLRADCSRCVGLCCVALAFVRSADFAFSKDAGDPCVNLDEEYRCSIHPELRQRGFKGCTVFDCFGAGQKVTQQTFDGASWRNEPGIGQPMFAVFPRVRQLHEMLWYLNEAAALHETASMLDELRDAYAATEALTEATADEILALDIDAHRGAIAPLLRRASELARAGIPLSDAARRMQPGSDYMGSQLAGRDLRGADFRGAWLIGADLRATDLTRADVIGADFRDAELGGANLAEALYLTQFQVNAAAGDESTVLPSSLSRPSHWRH
ncbi:MAG: pentapeptide repeat-containing protein [Mycetocola sp.]